MQILMNSRILIKILAPIGILIIMAAGLVVYSRQVLLELSVQAQRIVDVQAARQEYYLRFQIHITEATIQNRNIIIETREEQMKRFKNRQEIAIKNARQDTDRLIELSDTLERREMNNRMRQSAEAYFVVLSRATELGLRNEGEAAMKVAQEEAAPLRSALRDLVQNRTERSLQELTEAKLAARAAAERAADLLIVSAAAGLLLSTGLAVAIVVMGITRPLVNLVRMLQRMAQGDTDAEIREATRGDEIGSVGRAVEGIKVMVARKAAEEAEIRRRADAAAAAERKRTMAEMADSFEQAVGSIVTMVSSSATELQATAQTMTATAAETAAQSAAVAAAAEEASANVGTVAAAAEELGASIQEIGRQVDGSARLAQAAVEEAGLTAQQVRALTEVTARIGNVVGLISSIAAQTNLLALNATIEAARAGAAGRGFAVVAAEVKELAGQTAKATGEITSQVVAIQATTSQAAGAIGKITARIGEISGVATAIAAAVEEQGAATQEIVRNVSQASVGTSEVTGTIVGVAGAAEETGTAAVQVLTSASELSRQSEHLGSQVARFLQTVRAA